MTAQVLGLRPRFEVVGTGASRGEQSWVLSHQRSGGVQATGWTYRYSPSILEH